MHNILGNPAIKLMLHAVEPETWGDHKHTVHSGIGTCADKIHARTRGAAEAFHANGYSIMLVGHSMGAAVRRLLAVCGQ